MFEEPKPPAAGTAAFYILRCPRMFTTALHFHYCGLMDTRRWWFASLTFSREHAFFDRHVLHKILQYHRFTKAVTLQQFPVIQSMTVEVGAV